MLFVSFCVLLNPRCGHHVGQQGTQRQDAATTEMPRRQQYMKVRKDLFVCWFAHLFVWFLKKKRKQTNKLKKQICLCASVIALLSLFCSCSSLCFCFFGPFAARRCMCSPIGIDSFWLFISKGSWHNGLSIVILERKTFKVQVCLAASWVEFVVVFVSLVSSFVSLFVSCC